MSKSSHLASTVDILERFIDIAARRRDGPGMQDLCRRARRILDPPKPPRTALEAEQASIDLEHQMWVEEIADVFLPAQCDALVVALRIDHEDKEDPWAQVDPRVRRARKRRRAAEILRAEHAAIAACQRYQRTRRTSHLRDAVLELESAMRAQCLQMCSGLSKEACGKQGDRLERALLQVLPPSAFRYFVTRVRQAIAAHLVQARRTSSSPLSRPVQWLSQEAWTRGYDEEWAVGVWFTERFQQEYDAQMERDRLAEERRKTNADEDLFKQAAHDSEPSIDRTEDVPSFPDPPTEPSEPQGSRNQESEGTIGFVETQVPELDDSLNVAWPAHVEIATHYWEAVAQRRIAEYEEFREGIELQNSMEAERLRVEAAAKEAKQAALAWATRKSRPDWLQYPRGA